MRETDLEKLKYPIGKYEIPKPITDEILSNWISILEELPHKFAELTSSLSDEQLDTPYRPQGWTVRQVVHHVSDSHHNSYIRFKWGLTEDNPVIKPYFEQEWANLFDTRTAPIQMSLDHLSAVHFKLVYLLRGLSDEQLNRTFTHPDGNEVTTLKENVGRYVWHGSHHYAHISNLVQREGW
ncbi:YfiT family bacillithiol transferase [Croceivirga thetidis]|uniref:Bacillithiol transferase BstA n=1 Tax=Croceivirga thetidis TaxID=2721623 RepID=A0ABX1GSP4_9FLAO|nr:bacillithiol transferase BstA [Croceivirga thetidis]NKI32975.1 bacillithiol transferase BstA [Croceivirga thetidis]